MLYIRPVYEEERLLSLALCRTNGAILVDGDILEHFDKYTPGKEIKIIAQEFYQKEATWGSNIHTKR